MKDKEGNEVSGKEFLERWKGGMQSITPLQQTWLSLLSFQFVLVGIIIGLVVMSMNKVWWVVIILIGSLFLSLISFLGMLQKYWALKKVEQKMKELQNEEVDELNQIGGIINE